uniref:Transposase n=1 Tax=Leptobrachium leishanense TaxID=445787 RepID=A0A8C5PR46_9ANUR
MVHGKRTQSNPRTPARPQKAVVHSLDSYLLPAPSSSSPHADPKMADAQLPTAAADPTAAITRLELRLESLLAGMPTKADLADMLADLHNSVRRDVEEVREEVVALTDRVSRLEQAAAQPVAPQPVETPALSGLRRLVDDLDNRGRRCNLRLRGLMELDPPERLEEVRKRFFNEVLGNDPHMAMDFHRVHRALRPRPPEGDPPRDVCCFTSYQLKDKIMQRARPTRSWEFEGQTLEIYHDLTPFTLAARRHLRPITQALRQKNIPYRWGFPFALIAQLNSHAITSYGDVAPFLEATDLPPLAVVDWERGDTRPLGGQARSRRPPRRQRVREARDPEGLDHPAVEHQ